MTSSDPWSVSIYNELRGLAGFYLRDGPGAHRTPTLSPNALVHEAYLKLIVQKDEVDLSRTHFLARAAVAMRHVLIDHARTRKRKKRGAGWRPVTLKDIPAISEANQVDLLALDSALTQLAGLDPRGARVVELRFFGGLTEKEVGEVLGVSERTVRNDWLAARAWLRCALDDSESTP